MKEAVPRQMSSLIYGASFQFRLLSGVEMLSILTASSSWSQFSRSFGDLHQTRITLSGLRKYFIIPSMFPLWCNLINFDWRKMSAINHFLCCRCERKKLVAKAYTISFQFHLNKQRVRGNEDEKFRFRLSGTTTVFWKSWNVKHARWGVRGS